MTKILATLILLLKRKILNKKLKYSPLKPNLGLTMRQMLTKKTITINEGRITSITFCSAFRIIMNTLSLSRQLPSPMMQVRIFLKKSPLKLPLQELKHVSLPSNRILKDSLLLSEKKLDRQPQLPLSIKTKNYTNLSMPMGLYLPTPTLVLIPL